MPILPLRRECGQFQINGNVNMASINDAHGLRPGSSQSFNIAANTNPKGKDKKFFNKS